jgi:DNA invertase Pin-like site-specific DNA recombinase
LSERPDYIRLNARAPTDSDLNRMLKRRRCLTAYNEVKTGKRNDRPELAKKLADCKPSKDVLVLAKLNNDGTSPGGEEPRNP